MAYFLEQVNIERECTEAGSLEHFNFSLRFGKFLPFKKTFLSPGPRVLLACLKNSAS